MTIAAFIWVTGFPLAWAAFTIYSRPFADRLDALTGACIAFCLALLWPVFAVVGLWDLRLWAQRDRRRRRGVVTVDLPPWPEGEDVAGLREAWARDEVTR